MTDVPEKAKEPDYLKIIDEIEDRRKRIADGLEEDDWPGPEDFVGPAPTREQVEIGERRSWAQYGPPGCEELTSAIYIYPRQDLIEDFQYAVNESQHAYPNGRTIGPTNWFERETLFMNILRREVREALKRGDCSFWGLLRNDPDPKYKQVSRLVIDRVTIGWDDNTIAGLGLDLVDCKVCERGVTPNDEYSPSISRKTTKVASIGQSKKWLIDLMTAGEKEHPKPWYLSEAKSRFKIGDKNFNSVWKEAIQETGAESWSKGGRPKKPCQKKPGQQ